MGEVVRLVRQLRRRSSGDPWAVFRHRVVVGTAVAVIILLVSLAG